jgi:hypothetical protein
MCTVPKFLEICIQLHRMLRDHMLLDSASFHSKFTVKYQETHQFCAQSVKLLNNSLELIKVLPMLEP